MAYMMEEFIETYNKFMSNKVYQDRFVESKRNPVYLKIFKLRVVDKLTYKKISESVMGLNGLKSVSVTRIRQLVYKSNRILKSCIKEENYQGWVLYGNFLL